MLILNYYLSINQREYQNERDFDFERIISTSQINYNVVSDSKSKIRVDAWNYSTCCLPQNYGANNKESMLS